MLPIGCSLYQVNSELVLAAQQTTGRGMLLKPYLSKKFIARVVLIISSLSLPCFLYNRLFHQDSHSFWCFPLGLWLSEGDVISTGSVVFLLALVANFVLPPEPELEQKRNILDRLVTGVVVYVVLQVIAIGGVFIMVLFEGR
jgi:hypothetical protein